MKFGFKRKTGGGERVWLCALGKHPAWDDHFESPGLDTDRLAQLRTTLYSEGIGGRIDSGAWESLDPDERLEGFAHSLVWRTPDGLVVARIIDSSDGKGRKRYPLLVVAQSAGLPGAWVCGTLLDRVTQTASRIREMESRDEVLGEVQLVRSELRGESQLMDEASELAGGEPATADLTACAGGEAIERVLYQCRRDMRGFLRGSRRGEKTSSRTIDISAKHCRVPACGRTPGESGELWLRALDHLVGDTAPVMVIVPDSMAFADLIVGEPEASQVYCLQAGARALPLASEIPFEIDAESRGWVGAFLEETRGGSAPDRDPGWVGSRR